MTKRDEAYRIGRQAREQGIKEMRELINCYWDEAQYMSHTELTFAEAGLRGAEKPYQVTGWRYGHIPQGGLSYNARDDYNESGVSVMAIDGGVETQDKISAAFIAASGRPVVRVQGYLHTFRRGADGEPLLLDAVEIG